MAPNGVQNELIICDNLDSIKFENNLNYEIESYKNQKYIWYKVLLFGGLHLSAIYGTYLMFVSASIWTTLFAILLYQLGEFGVTGGAHRLWSHGSFKATWQLKVILMICETIAFQDLIIVWARDHRVHHKHTDKLPDPHNSNRGFFYSHIGWLMRDKLPETIHEGKLVYLKDLMNDPIVQFQRKHYLKLMPILCFILPTIMPWYFWNESIINGFFVAVLWRYTITLNATCLINSAAHIWGSKPYDKNKNATENLFVSIMASGEGWHNYHHTFPWDYKNAELGGGRINLTSTLIDLFAKIGWAYDLKTVSDETIKQRAMKTGDGTHPIWGWGDKDQSLENSESASVIQPKLVQN